MVLFRLLQAALQLRQRHCFVCRNHALFAVFVGNVRVKACFVTLGPAYSVTSQHVCIKTDKETSPSPEIAIMLRGHAVGERPMLAVVVSWWWRSCTPISCR